MFIIINKNDKIYIRDVIVKNISETVKYRLILLYFGFGFSNSTDEIFLPGSA